MKKILMTFLMAAAMFLFCNVTVNATEMIIYQLKEETSVKEQADANSKTVALLGQGTPVLLVEEEQDWVKIRYQEYTGYVPSTAVSAYADTGNLEEEFADIEKTFAGIYQRTLDIQREDMQELIWKIVITLLGIAIVVSAIMMGARKLVREKQEEKED